MPPTLDTFCSRSYLQGICHRAPLDGLAVSGAVNHDKAHSRCHCCHQHGLNHLQAGSVDVPVNRGVTVAPRAVGSTSTARLAMSHQAHDSLAASAPCLDPARLCCCLKSC